MAENKDYAVRSEENGTVNISDEVICTVAAVAARDVDGVYGLNGNLGDDIFSMLGRKNIKKGVRLQIDDDGVSLECNVIAKYGCSVVEMAKNLQVAIRAAVESMTGLAVKNVTVNICGISAAAK